MRLNEICVFMTIAFIRAAVAKLVKNNKRANLYRAIAKNQICKN